MANKWFPTLENQRHSDKTQTLMRGKCIKADKRGRWTSAYVCLRRARTWRVTFRTAGYRNRVMFEAQRKHITPHTMLYLTSVKYEHAVNRLRYFLPDEG